jgi:hypothetical protein
VAQGLLALDAAQEVDEMADAEALIVARRRQAASA